MSSKGSCSLIRTRRIILFGWVVGMLFTFSSDSVAQKRFSVILTVPENLNSGNLSVSYDNGKEETRIKDKVSKDFQIRVSGTFYSKYLALTLRYPRRENTNAIYQVSFFLGDIPAMITLLSADSSGSPFERYKLVNALDFKKDIEDMSRYDSLEVSETSAFMLRKGANMADWMQDSIARNEWMDLQTRLAEKDYKFVLDHPLSYYSFWFFRRDIAQSNIRTADSLLHVFNSIFPEEFRNSQEGNTIVNILNGRLSVRLGGVVPDFSSSDVRGKEIRFTDYRGKRPVLMVFWATWCGPCMMEMPVIKSIRDSFSSERLAIIAVSYASDYQATLKAIKDNGMNWTCIYNDRDLINAFGGDKPIPRIYLIDTSGKVIYDRNEMGDDMQLTKLVALLKVID